MTNSDLTINIILLLLLLMASALVSGSEIAMFSLTKKDIEEIEKQRKKLLIMTLLERPKKLLATILVVNNFINIAIVVISVQITNLIFANLEPWLKFTLEIGLVSFIILFFGEILPKIYASRNSVLFSLKVADIIQFLNIALTPISMPMRSFSIFVEKKFKQQSSNFSVDHLSHALELTSDEETTLEEHKILQGIVNFGNTDTRQVMKPRIDVFALNESTSFSEVLPLIVENGYSRVPVYKENLDTVVGVLYSKDLLPHIDKKDFKWISLLRQPYFVPENKKLDDLLKEFQEKKIHLAIVVDEYGGTSGIVSLEDIIEQIVGDISDEFDDEDLIYSKLDDHNYIFEGKTNLQEFYKAINLEDETMFENAKGESETLAGLLLEISGRFPKKGEVILFDNFKFTIEALDKKRIKQIKITLNQLQ
ncbi:MAG: gliding motility-associated protein GldE [Flavobacteriales bacterium CG_4_9_14_3_um_filter_40_17]|nr:MAG: gliding motility-associated protein GldE [Flavobacteriales bacterium CG_4_9_14_3_um_filter_40_17]